MGDGHARFRGRAYEEEVEECSGSDEWLCSEQQSPS
jgi:hypothetical protein